MRSRMNTDFKENRVRLSAAAALLLPSLLFCSCSAQDRWQPVEVVAEAVEAPGESVPAQPTESAATQPAEAAVSETTVETAQEKETSGWADPIERPKVKGIYVTGPMAGTQNMDGLIDLVDRTELNAMVIDLKNDEGYVVCETTSPLVEELGTMKRYVRDMPGLVARCKEKGIYLIARIVAFKDPLLTAARPEWSLHKGDGTVFLDKDGAAWVNPYEKEAWEYLHQIAEGAAALGFDEVQFDYVRFSTDAGMQDVDFGPQAEGLSKMQIIEAFAEYMADCLHPLGVAVSADVYGMVIDSQVDQQIVGQDYAALARHLDYISPMVYPSHYGPYNYDIPVPDAQPYETVLAAMQASRKTLAGIGTETGSVSENEPGPVGSVSGHEPGPVGSISGNDLGAAETVSGNEIAALQPMDGIRAKVRPWLQDFTASWVAGHISYGPEQIRAQIQAVYDAGYEEWILWNASNRYTEGGLQSSAEQTAG